MKGFKNKLENTKDKVMGEIENKIGEVTDKETLELKGKIQIAKAQIKEHVNKDMIKHEFEDMKEDVAGMINDIIDEEGK